MLYSWEDRKRVEMERNYSEEKSFGTINNGKIMIWGIGSPVRRVFACTELLRFLGPRVGKNNQALRNLFRSAWLSVVRGSVFRVATLGANALFVKSDAAQWAAVDLVVGFKFCGGCVNAARKGDFGNIWFVFERIVDNFNHAFHRHGFLGDPRRHSG